MTFVITIVMTIVLSRTKLNAELETVKANGIINKEEAERKVRKRKDKKETGLFKRICFRQGNSH